MEAPWLLLQPEGGAQPHAPAALVAPEADDALAWLWDAPADGAELAFLQDVQLSPEPAGGAPAGAWACLERAAPSGDKGQHPPRVAKSEAEAEAQAPSAMAARPWQQPAAQRSACGPHDDAGAQRRAKRLRGDLRLSTPAQPSDVQWPPSPPLLPAAVLHPAPQAGALCVRSVSELLARDVSPHLAAYAGIVTVPNGVFAARAEPRAPLATYNVPSMRAIIMACAALHSQTTRHAAAVRESCAALRAAGNADTPAWLLGAAAPPHAENALHVLHQHTHALTATFEDSGCARRGYVAVLKRPLSAPERAQMADYGASLSALHVFLSSAQSLLAQLRCRRGGAADYLDASAGVLDLLGAITAVTESAYSARIAEFGARAAANAAWPSPYRQYAAAAGVTLAAEPDEGALT